MYSVVGVAALALLVSCKKESLGGAAESSGYRSPDLSSVPEGNFSDWMSKADQQLAYDGLKKGKYFSSLEGRSNGGFHQYRHVAKTFPVKESSEWGVFWGLSSDEFYQIDLKMQRQGFKRKSLQVFEDGSGQAFHQGVWVLPAKK